MKRGFTLVELSIVLVIIGLLIGGILAAQSMINTAKIQALVRQVGQFDAAVENFQTRYNQLPGDSNLMGTITGNNDGIICVMFNCSYPINSTGGEEFTFWSDLSASGFTNAIGKSFLDINSASYTGNINDYDPIAAAGDTAVFFAKGSYVTSANYYLVTNLSNIGYTRNAFKPADVLAIDQKLDDGFANTGNISGWDTNYYAGSTITVDSLNTTNCTTIPGGTAYNVTKSNDVCSIRIRMGTSTGDLK